MNIFYLDHSPSTCAQYHCDKHVVKMIVEYAQLLSTAHRVLDGEQYYELSEAGRKVKRWRLNDQRESIVYKASHINHPSAIWVRKSAENYQHLVELFKALLGEYTHRYEKQHACSKLVWILNYTPKNIGKAGFSEPPQAMPDHCKVPGDSVSAYRKYYCMEKKHFVKWTNRENPYWFYDMSDKYTPNVNNMRILDGISEALTTD